MKCIGSSDVAFKTIDMKTNDKIEGISMIIYFVQVKITMAALMLPAMLITLLNYFIFNEKDQSCVLPFPIMYVHNIRIGHYHANKMNSHHVWFLILSTITWSVIDILVILGDFSQFLFLKCLYKRPILNEKVFWGWKDLLMVGRSI